MIAAAFSQTLQFVQCDREPCILVVRVHNIWQYDISWPLWSVCVKLRAEWLVMKCDDLVHIFFALEIAECTLFIHFSFDHELTLPLLHTINYHNNSSESKQSEPSNTTRICKMIFHHISEVCKILKFSNILHEAFSVPVAHTTKSCTHCFTEVCIVHYFFVLYSWEKLKRDCQFCDHWIWTSYVTQKQMHIECQTYLEINSNSGKQLIDVTMGVANLKKCTVILFKNSTIN